MDASRSNIAVFQLAAAVLLLGGLCGLASGASSVAGDQDGAMPAAGCSPNAGTCFHGGKGIPIIPRGDHHMAAFRRPSAEDVLTGPSTATLRFSDDATHDATLVAAGPSAGAADASRSASTGSIACSSTPVTVRSQDPRDAETLCRGALAATDFFRSLGQPTDTALALDVVEQLPPAVDRLAVGCYSRIDRRAYVLTYDAFSTRGTWLGLPVSRELYESVGAHEVAHALTACTAAAYPLSVQATEYIAAVVMFGAMHAPSRAAVLAQYPDADFASDWEITDVAYGLDPIRFAVGAYRHFLREPDPAGFLRSILVGTVLGERHHY
jgi:hypothetical protein